jgi:hypothetical protein
MPNHVINEIVFSDITAGQRAAILASVLNAENRIDFGILLPIPLNCWMGSVSVLHEKAFKNTALDWCTANWGTKWGAYSQEPIEDADDSLRMVFQTAWRPPYGWLCALFNRFMLPFDHRWLDEGARFGCIGRFDPKFLDDRGGEPWSERDAHPDEHKRLHLLKWGVEAFDDEET